MGSPSDLKPIVVVVGPTAVGKSAISIALAQALNAEIVNADSMQLYRGMDIGTAKLPMAERGDIEHHMLDVLDVTETANVAEYQRGTRSVIEQIQSRGKQVVLVGGSGLFVQAVLEAMEFPGSDPGIRQRLTDEARELGTETLYQRLVGLDSQAAMNILPTNERRIIRALEVIELTGEAPTTTIGDLPVVVPSIRIGLRCSREILDDRIEQRVAVMWEQGLVQEVQELEQKGLRDGLTASKALGYAQLLDYLSGDCSEADARIRTVTGTRRYVRRQESWFNRDKRIAWFDVANPGDVSEHQRLLAEVLTHINSANIV